MGLCTLLVVLSPKSHAQLVTDPVVVFVNATLNGAVPLVGLALKFTTGSGGADADGGGGRLTRRATGSGGSEDDCVAARRAVDVRGALYVAGGAVAEVPSPRGDRSGGRVGEGNAQRRGAAGWHLR